MNGTFSKREYTIHQETLRDSVIQGTRNIISKMSEEQKYRKAKAHIIDALNFKHPRYYSECL